MQGGIYTREKCPICGALLNNSVRDGINCKQHPEIRASKFFVKFKKTFRNFKNFHLADKFLTGLRFKTDEGSYDARDYRRDNPLGFTNMSNKFLESVKPKTAKNMKPHIDHAQAKFENRNVKELKCGDFEDLINALDLSDKTKHNIISTMKVFYRWMLRREEISSLPEFPIVSFVLGYRNTVSKEVQNQIIEEVKRIAPVKVYLGIKWLATYFSIRPNEMINLKEGDIDIGNAYLYFPHPKERKFKSVPILPEDVSLLKSFGLSSPAMRFFRHDGGIKATRKDQSYGEKYFYKWWVIACRNLSIEGVDLYGGTRHSTVRAKRKDFTPEQLKEAAMSKTNKAFDRYYGEANDEQIREVYSNNVIEFKKVKNNDGNNQ